MLEVRAGIMPLQSIAMASTGNACLRHEFLVLLLRFVARNGAYGHENRVQEMAPGSCNLGSPR